MTLVRGKWLKEKNDMTNRNKQKSKITSADTTSESNKNVVTEENIAIGVVSNCKSLNVRKQPSKASKVLCTVRFAEEVTINVTKSNENWFNIKTKTNVEGFCMRDFINVKS